MELPDPEWIIEGVIQRQGVGSIYSLPGTGKTTLLGGIFVAIATGRPWFGHTVRHPGACLYVAAEDPAGFKVRLRSAKRAAHVALDAPIGIYTFPEAVDLRDPLSVRMFVHFVKGGQWPQPLEGEDLSGAVRVSHSRSFPTE